MKKFLKLIFKLILKTDWDSFWSWFFLLTLLATIVFFLFTIIKHTITKPKCDIDKRVEFIDKCESKGNSIFICDRLSIDLYCTK